MEAVRASHAKAHPRSTPVQNAGQNYLELLGRSLAPDQAEVHSETTSTRFRPTGKISVNNVLELLRWQNFRCALTGRVLSPDEASLDHIIPVRDGGEHVIENTQILHRDVNRAKSVLPNEVFITMCREVVAHNS
jgi:hypothetical protein